MIRQFRVIIWTTAAVVLTLGIVYLAFGQAIEDRVRHWLSERLTPWEAAGVVVTALAIDLLVPIPSSTVSTFAGQQLGMAGGTIAAWTGTSLGAVAGFGLGRLVARRSLAQWVHPDDEARIRFLSDRYGPRVVVLCRALPLLAEASVVCLGAAGLEWRRFLPGVLLSNLGIAAAYAIFGQWSKNAPLLALLLSVAVPLGGLALARVLIPLRAGLPTRTQP